MDDLLVSCPSTKKPINNKILVSLGAKFNKFTIDTPFRKTSIGSLQEIHHKDTNDSLNRVLSSPSLKSPVRTPVTENDPLGALCIEKKVEETDGIQKLPSLETVRNLSSEIELDCTGTPILFDRRKGQWDLLPKTNDQIDGASDEYDEEDEKRLKELNSSVCEENISRASTLPADDKERGGEHDSPFKTSLSNFKLPFR